MVTSQITNSPFDQISARPIETTYPMANNPVGHASNNQTGSVFGNSVGHYMNNPMTMNTNLNPSMGYHFPDQQSRANLQNNMWYNNQPRITGQLFNQNQGLYNPNTGFHRPKERTQRTRYF